MNVSGTTSPANISKTNRRELHQPVRINFQSCRITVLQTMVVPIFSVSKLGRDHSVRIVFDYGRGLHQPSLAAGIRLVAVPWHVIIIDSDVYQVMRKGKCRSGRPWVRARRVDTLNEQLRQKIFKLLP